MFRKDRRRFLKGIGLAACGIGLATLESQTTTAADESAGTGWPTFQHDAQNTGSVSTSPGLQFPKVGSSVQTWLPLHSRLVISDGVAYYTSDAVIAKDLTSGSQVWSTEFSAADAPIGEDLSPTVGGDTLVVSGGGVVTALARSDGSVHWQYETDSEDSSSTKVVDSTVYVTSDTGWCHAISLADGTREWAFETSGDVNTYRLFGVPAVADGTVFVPTSQGVYALSAATGEVQWTGAASEFPPVVGDGSVYVVQGDNVAALDQSTGEELWRTDAEYDVRSTPVVADGRVFVRRYPDSVHAIDAADGTELWEAEPGDASYAQLAAAGDTLYVPTATDFYHQLVAFDAATGEVRWRHYRSDLEIPEPLGAYLADGSLYFLNGGRRLQKLVDGPRSFRWPYELQTSADDGNESEYLPETPPVASQYAVYVSHPTTTDSLLIAIEDDKGGRHWAVGSDATLGVGDMGVYAVDGGQLTAYDFVETDGLFEAESERWTESLKPLTTAPLAVDGTVYVGSEAADDAATVYAINAESGDTRWTFTGSGCPPLETVTAGPASLGERIVAGTANQLFALTKANGGIVWTDVGTVEHAATNDSQAFAAGDGTLRAVSAAGDDQWSVDIAGSVQGLVADGDAVYAQVVSSGGDRLVAVDAADGTWIWEYTDANADALTPPRVTDTAVYVGSGASVRALAPADGSEIREYETDDSVVQPPAVTDGSVYAATAAAEMVAFDRTE